MPKSRRKPTRPIHAIAFSVGFACNSVPPSHLTYLNNSLPRNVSVQHLEKALCDLHVPDSAFAAALLFLSDLNHTKVQVERHHILLVYAVLYRLASIDPSRVESFREAAEDAVWLCFITAAGTPAAKVITFTRWHQFNAYLGSSVGGIDSLPAEGSERQFRSAWRHGRSVALPFPGDMALSFPRLLMAMREFDAGLVIVLRSIATIWSHAVEAATNPGAGNTNLVTPVITDFDAHATFLSQFVLMALQQLANGQRLSESFQHVIVPDRQQKSPAQSGVVADQQICNHHEESSQRVRYDSSASELFMCEEKVQYTEQGDDGTDVTNEIELTQTWKTDVTNESTENLANGHSDSFASPMASNKSGTDGMNGNSESGAFNSSLARVSQRALWVRRKQSTRGGSSPFHIDFSSIQLGRKLGEGAYGEVYHGTYLMSPVAVKVFRVNVCTNWETDVDDDPGHLNRMSTMNALQRFASTTSLAKYRNFVREVEMMSLVRHPNLVLYMGACGDPSSPLCIVSELFTGGSLHEYLHKDVDYQPTLLTAIGITLDIARGMYYLHSSEPSILHRDLKARNVLLSGRGDRNGVPHVVICDFGLCQLFGETIGHRGCNGNIGTPAYTSPDVINGRVFDAKDDVYSFGILMHEVLTGCVPYEGMRAMQVVYQVTNDGLRPSNKLDDHIPQSVTSLMTRCWHENRDQRPMFDEIISELVKLKDEFT